MYFANIFSFAHQAFESFIQDVGFRWEEWFDGSKMVVPIRHTECNFLIPLRGGETFQVQTEVKKLGKSSFTLSHTFLRESKTHAIVTMTHVYVDRVTEKTIPIPELHRQRLGQF